MLRGLTSFSEKTGAKIGESRRNFLSHIGGGVLTLAGALLGALGASRAEGTWVDSSDGNASGACYYASGGTPRCEELTQVQCRSLNGSTWVGGQPCGLRSAPA
jgi:hypothetical protein